MLYDLTTRRDQPISHSLLYASYQIDFTVSDRYSYEKIHTASLGTARQANLSTSHHHIKPEPFIAFPTMPCAYNIAVCAFLFKRFTWSISAGGTLMLSVTTWWVLDSFRVVCVLFYLWYFRDESVGDNYLRFIVNAASNPPNTRRRLQPMVAQC